MKSALTFFYLSALPLLLLMTGCTELASGGVLDRSGGGAAVGRVHNSQQAKACDRLLMQHVAAEGLTTAEDVNSLIERIQDKADGCGVFIWNPLATGDPEADKCLRDMMVSTSTMGVLGGSGGIFITHREGSAGEGCFAYHARRGVWVGSGLDHAREFMRSKEGENAPFALQTPTPRYQGFSDEEIELLESFR